MNIAVIGTGNVGSALGTRWAAIGHQVVFGSRNPGTSRVRDSLESAGPNARAVRLNEATAGAEVVVLATPWNVSEEVIRTLGGLEGKIIADCTNPLSSDLTELVIGHSTSAGEKVSRWANGARVVKAFNTIGAKNIAKPTYDSQNPTMFICGDDADANSTIAELGRELGFDVVDAGPLKVARYLEPLAMLWIHLAYFRGFGPDFAFKIIGRQETRQMT